MSVRVRVLETIAMSSSPSSPEESLKEGLSVAWRSARLWVAGTVGIRVVRVAWERVVMLSRAMA